MMSSILGFWIITKFVRIIIIFGVQHFESELMCKVHTSPYQCCHFA